jgi:transcription initiation factor IIE alpha subunit
MTVLPGPQVKCPYCGGIFTYNKWEQAEAELKRKMDLLNKKIAALSEPK